MKLNVFLEIDDDYIEELQTSPVLFIEFKNFIIKKLISNPDIKLFICKGKINNFQMAFGNIIREGKLEFWQKEEPLTTINDSIGYYTYYKWNFCDTVIQLNSYNEVIVEIAKIQNFYKNPCLLLTSFSTTKYGNHSIYVIRDNLTRQPFNSYWEEIKYSEPKLSKEPDGSYINKTFEEWYKGYKNNRIHKANPKHDKNKPIANKDEKVSLLLCNEEEAQKMLNSALNASTASETFPKFLHNFDSIQKKYIEFKLERVTDANVAIYHGYHLDRFDDIEAKLQNKSIRILLEKMQKEKRQ
jgi:hypothetical protein